MGPFRPVAQRSGPVGVRGEGLSVTHKFAWPLGSRTDPTGSGDFPVADPIPYAERHFEGRGCAAQGDGKVAPPRGPF